MYDDIKLYIQRIANGDSSPIISAQPISELLTSSGTSGGQPKIMHSIPEELERKRLLHNLLVPTMSHWMVYKSLHRYEIHIGHEWYGLDVYADTFLAWAKEKAMYVLFIKAEVTAPSGLKARPVLTCYSKFNVNTSPDETIICPNSRQSIFCQLLCFCLCISEGYLRFVPCTPPLNALSV